MRPTELPCNCNASFDSINQIEPSLISSCSALYTPSAAQTAASCLLEPAPGKVSQLRFCHSLIWLSLTQGTAACIPGPIAHFFFYYIRIVFLFSGVMKIIWTLNFNVCKTKQNHIGTLQCIAICFHIICGCFHARAVELSICNENQMACKVQVTITWLLIEKGHWPLLWCSDHSGRLIFFFQGCDLSFYSLCFLSMQTASSF